MNQSNQTEHHFSGIAPFSLEAGYHEDNKDEMIAFSHVHEACEIYVNISGDVSFAVENRIYPIEPGSIIITRPFEYHRCIYHSNKVHRHFCFFFTGKGNEFLLERFFQRQAGQNNHLKPDKQGAEKIIALCRELTAGEGSPAENYYRFFRLLHELERADNSGVEGSYPADVLYAVDYIGRHFKHPVRVEEIAKEAGVSINTLERHFFDSLKTTPSSYIRQKRLAHAAKLLSQGKTVSETAEESGFSDYSGFIALFKKTYSLTPLKYQKKQLSD